MSHRIRHFFIFVFATASLAALPVRSDAGWVGFRNDTSAPVIVQGVSTGKNAVRLGKPRLLYPGEVYWDCILQPGEKNITITDAKQPTKTLYTGRISCGKLGQLLSIRGDGSSQAKLVPLKSSTSAGGRSSR